MMLTSMLWAGNKLLPCLHTHFPNVGQQDMGQGELDRNATCTCCALPIDSPPPVQTLHMGLHNPDLVVAVRRHADHDCLKLAKDSTPIDYPKPDGVTTFDLPTSLYRSGRESYTHVCVYTGIQQAGKLAHSRAACRGLHLKSYKTACRSHLHMGIVARCRAVSQHSVMPALVLCVAVTDLCLFMEPSWHWLLFIAAASFCRHQP